MIGIRNAYNTKNNSLFESVPDRIQLGDTHYTLSACIYGDGAHFISMVRDFQTNRLYTCDGMANNAPKIPMDIAYFLRSEYITFLPGGGGKGKQG
jgi:hypothetical protein